MDQFIKPVTHYRRRVDLIRDYVEDAAKYLTVMTGDPMEKTRDFVKRSITTGRRALKMPRAMFLIKNKHGDRELQQLPFHQYLQRAFGNNEIISPTLTTYMPASQKKSLLATYIAGNLKRRSSAKKAMFQAEKDGLTALRETLNSQQQTFKIKNNALSGAHCSPFTPLWNKSAHSTLTSVCRSATSYANATNEKYLYGNRHYYSPDIVKTNLISIINHSDLPRINATMQRYGIAAPTTDQVMSCILRGTETYWRNDEQMRQIRELVVRLNPNERAAFLYTSDLYHLAEVNPQFVRTFLGKLATKITAPITDMEVAQKEVKAMDENMEAFVAILCATELRGNDVKAAFARPEDYGVIAATARQKRETIEEYGEFIQTFWVTDNLPSSVFAVPAIVRRGVLTSDTDSTIFTTQQWVEWMQGKVDFEPESVATACSVVYLSSQLVRHVLATLCGNMGVEQEEIFRLKMKNEYYFPVFALTSRAKHYYAYMAAQEGLVFEKLKNEIKGVALRSSAVAAEIIDLSHQTMFDIMDTVMRGDKISLTAIVRRVATIEREVLEEVKTGSFEYFKKTRIQDKEAYKSENSNYQHYELWEEAFAGKYGHAPQPPYQAIKASLVTDKRQAFIEWLDKMPDQTIASKIRDWAHRNNKFYIGTIYMPSINLIAHGVPSEISAAVDVRSLVAQLMESFYLILEGLGVYARNKKITRLISDDRTILSLPEGVLQSVKNKKK